MHQRGDPRRRAGIAPFLLPLVAAAATAGAMWQLTKRYGRYEVRGESMAPALNPGDWIAVDRQAYSSQAPRPRHVVLARDPRAPSRTLVKRVHHIDLHGRAWLLGDNEAASTDSRTFGPVMPEAILGRVRWRYWPIKRRRYLGPV
jgi:nickel-type superoxide dismutase maturation protease